MQTLYLIFEKNNSSQKWPRRPHAKECRAGKGLSSSQKYLCGVYNKVRPGLEISEWRENCIRSWADFKLEYQMGKAGGKTGNRIKYERGEQAQTHLLSLLHMNQNLHLFSDIVSLDLQSAGSGNYHFLST